MFKNKFFYLIPLMLLFSFISFTNDSGLIHTGKLRIYHLVIGLIVFVVGGILFVFVIDKLLAPKSKKTANKKSKTNSKSVKDDNTGDSK